MIWTSLLREESLKSLSASSAKTLLSLVKIDDDLSIGRLLLGRDCDETSFGCGMLACEDISDELLAQLPSYEARSML